MQQYFSVVENGAIPKKLKPLTLIRTVKPEPEETERFLRAVVNSKASGYLPDGFNLDGDTLLKMASFTVPQDLSDVESAVDPVPIWMGRTYPVQVFDDLVGANGVIYNQVIAKGNPSGAYNLWINISHAGDEVARETVEPTGWFGNLSADTEIERGNLLLQNGARVGVPLGYVEITDVDSFLDWYLPFWGNINGATDSIVKNINKVLQNGERPVLFLRLDGIPARLKNKMHEGAGIHNTRLVADFNPTLRNYNNMMGRLAAQKLQDELCIAADFGPNGFWYDFSQGSVITDAINGLGRMAMGDVITEAESRAVIEFYKFYVERSFRAVMAAIKQDESIEPIALVNDAASGRNITLNLISLDFELKNVARRLPRSEPDEAYLWTFFRNCLCDSLADALAHYYQNSFGLEKDTSYYAQQLFWKLMA